MYTSVLKKDTCTWKQWCRFCNWMNVSPDLQGVKYPVPFLQIFPERVHARLLYAGDAWWSNIHAPSTKYFPPWGPKNPDTTGWSRSIFVWAKILRPTRRHALLLSGSNPSQCKLSTPRKPPSIQVHQGSKQSAISSWSHSSSSCAQDNTARVVQTPCRTPSDSNTSSS